MPLLAPFALQKPYKTRKLSWRNLRSKFDLQSESETEQIMQILDKVKFLFRQTKCETGFEAFQEYFFILLNLSGFNVLRKGFFSGVRNRALIIFISLLPVFGALASVRVVWKYFDDVEEMATGSISCLIIFQLIPKMIELLVHREDHREMMAIVARKTGALKNNSDYRDVGVENFNRARVYILLTSISFISALISLHLYPFFPMLIKNEYKLGPNMELPGTHHKEPIGWLINYIFCLVMASSTAFLILGK